MNPNDNDQRLLEVSMKLQPLLYEINNLLPDNIKLQVALSELFMAAGNLMREFGHYYTNKGYKEKLND